MVSKVKMIDMEKSQFITWQCKCGTTYALERNVPIGLYEKHPDRKKCRKEVAKDKLCGTPFPDQAKRDELFKFQYEIVEE